MCTDGDDNPDNNCKQNGFMPTCEEARCGYVHYRTSGFLDGYSCSVSSPDYPGRWAGQTIPHDAGGADKESEWYYGGGTIFVTCSANTGWRQSVTTGFEWPP